MFPQRVVLDTNVLISTLVFSQRALAWLPLAWLLEIIRPPASQDTASELTRVLAYSKFNLAGEEQARLAIQYLPWCEIVTVSDSITVPDCRDPSDRPFLTLALAAQADAIITGDKDLLVLADDFPIPILTPAMLKEELRGMENSS